MWNKDHRPGFHLHRSCDHYDCILIVQARLCPRLDVFASEKELACLLPPFQLHNRRVIRQPEPSSIQIRFKHLRMASFITSIDYIKKPFHALKEFTLEGLVDVRNQAGLTIGLLVQINIPSRVSERLSWRHFFVFYSRFIETSRFSSLRLSRECAKQLYRSRVHYRIKAPSLRVLSSASRSFGRLLEQSLHLVHP